jgi:hypothetical protein
MTVADVQLTLAIVELEQCIIDTNFRNSINNLNAHFKKVTETEVFKGRLGCVK